MKIYDSGDITVKRGDASAFTFAFYADDAETELYTPDAGDVLALTIRKNYNDAVPVLRKVLAGYTAEVTSAESELMTAGTYVYDITLTLESGSTVRIGPYAYVVTNNAGRRGDA